MATIDALRAAYQTAFVTYTHAVLAYSENRSAANKTARDLAYNSFLAAERVYMQAFSSSGGGGSISNEGITYPYMWWDVQATGIWHTNSDGSRWIVYPASNGHGSYVYIIRADGNTEIMVHEGDLPQVQPGYQVAGTISYPCANPGYTLYSITENNTPTQPIVLIRAQSWRIRAALQALRENPVKIIATVSKEFSENCGIKAAAVGQIQQDIIIRSAVRGDRSINLRQKAAIQIYRSVDIKIDAAVATSFETPVEIMAACVGTRNATHRQRAAVRGLHQVSFGIRANVVIDRTLQILLEMENLFVQESGFVSVPNAASKTKDWRKQPLG